MVMTVATLIPASDSRPVDRVGRRLVDAWPVVIGLAALLGLFVLAVFDVAGQAFLWENAHWVLSAGLAAAFAVVRLRADRRPQVALLAGGVVLYLLAQLLYVVQLMFQAYSVPAPSDVAFLVSVIPMAAGVMWLHGVSMSPAERTAVALDGATLAALFATGIILVYAPHAASTDPLAGATLLAYPIVFLGAAGGAAVAGLAHGIRPRLRGGTLVLAGLAMLGGAWVAWLGEALTAYPSPGSFINVVASVGILAVGAGVFTWDDTSTPDSGFSQLATILLGLVPIISILVAVGLLAGLELLFIEHPQNEAANWLLHAGAVLTCLLAVGRQTLLLRDRSELLGSERAARGQAAAALASRESIDRRFRASIDVLDQLRERMLLAETESEVVSATTAVLRRLVPTTRGDVLIINWSQDRLVVADAWGADAPAVGSAVDVDRPTRCLGIRRGTTHIEPDVAAHDALHCPAHSSASGAVACVPLQAMGETLGVIHLERDAAGGFEHDDVSQATQVVGQAAVALANRRLIASMETLALTDPLTGLYNSRFFDQSADRELSTAERSGQPVGMIMVDIDHFKRFNDTYGHAAGDAALREFARVVGHVMRPADTLARYGGEEFAIVVRGGDERATHAVAERARAAVEALTLDLGGEQAAWMTASFGCASSEHYGLDRVALMRAADGALYEAKRAGRNRVVVATETSPATT